MTKQQPASRFSILFVSAFCLMTTTCCCEAWSASSAFVGQSIRQRHDIGDTMPRTVKSYLSMRKQKASDKRTSRRQRGGPQVLEAPPPPMMTITRTASPMQGNAWTQKVMEDATESTTSGGGGGGRQRSRKRSLLYNRMAGYHNTYLRALTLEYKAEVRKEMYSFSNSTRCLFTHSAFCLLLFTGRTSPRSHQGESRRSVGARNGRALFLRHARGTTREFVRGRSLPFAQGGGCDDRLSTFG